MVDFFRVFANPWDTVWWMGRDYHAAYGQEWPGKEDPGPGFKNPSPRDALVVVAAMAIFLTFVRTVFERYIGSSVALLAGIRQCKRRPCSENPRLESLLVQHSYAMPPESALVALGNETGESVKSQQRWIRRRQQAVLSTRHTKFTESSWRFVFYSTMFTYGITSLCDEDFLWDTKYCWIGYPMKIWAMKDKIYWYYMIELGYYMSCLVLQFFEVKRKDFKEMFIHHVATVFLIAMSFVTARTRIGALVMVVHDFSDISLEACKMAKYARMTETANVLFGTFALSFFLSRIIYFPYSILYSALFETGEFSDYSGGSALGTLNTLLCVLYVLHLFWFSLALRLIAKFAKNEQPDGDLRSEDEAPTTSSEDDSKKDN